MENVPDRFKMKYDNLKLKINNFQTNGTPIREISKKLRENIEISYNNLINKTNQIENKYENITN